MAFVQLSRSLIFTDKLMDSVLGSSYLIKDNELFVSMRAGVAVGFNDYAELMLCENITESMESRTSVEAIITFAHRLGIKIIAEFVSNKKIYEVMKELKADFCQGHFFGKPEEACC